MDAPALTLELLRSHREGDPVAVDQLFEHLYEDLRQAARRRLRELRAGETLNTTAVVHEAYLRLVEGEGATAEDRAHFLALASRAMRFVLVDHARAWSAAKRGGREPHLPLEAVELAAEARAHEILELNEALEALAKHSERLAQVVEWRFFAGLTYEEMAELSQRSVPTVKRDWTRARAWLLHALEATGEPSASPPSS